MNINTFYYTLSTIPQIVAAISAILAVFLFRRLETLKNILIGYGQSVYDRSKDKEYDFMFQNNNHQKITQDLRLRDAVHRKNIREVKLVIKFYKNQENKSEEKGITINKETGLRHVYDEFCRTEQLYIKIKHFAKVTFIISTTSLLLSVFSLSFADYLFTNYGSKILNINLILFFLAIILSAIVVFIGLKEEGYN